MLDGAFHRMVVATTASCAMNTFNLRSLSLLALAASAISAQAVVVNFDDLSGYGAVADNYAGFVSWGDFQHYDDAQSPYNPHSGLTRVYSYGDSGIDIGQDVSFVGAWFAGYTGSTEISLGLFNDGVLVHTSGSIGLSDVPTFLSSGYAGAVDKVVVNGQPGYYVMDDFEYNRFGVSSVPGPAAVVPFLVGGISALRKRRKA
jgi:hypothetical protein